MGQMLNPSPGSNPTRKGRLCRQPDAEYSFVLWLGTNPTPFLMSYCMFCMYSSSRSVQSRGSKPAARILERSRSECSGRGAMGPSADA